MSELSTQIVELKREISEFTVPLQTTREVLVAEFDNIVTRIEGVLRLVSAAEDLPKELLVEVYYFGQVVRNEAAALRSDALLAMADRVEFLFGLMLKGETSDSRHPGVPRIV